MSAYEVATRTAKFRAAHLRESGRMEVAVDAGIAPGDEALVLGESIYVDGTPGRAAIRVDVVFRISKLAELRRRMCGEQPPAGSHWGRVDLDNFANACLQGAPTECVLMRGLVLRSLGGRAWDDVVDPPDPRFMSARELDRFRLEWRAMTARYTDCARYLATVSTDAKLREFGAKWRMRRGQTATGHLWDPRLVNPEAAWCDAGSEFALAACEDLGHVDAAFEPKHNERISMLASSFRQLMPRPTTAPNDMRAMLSEAAIARDFGPILGGDRLDAETQAHRRHLIARYGGILRACEAQMRPIGIIVARSWAAGQIVEHHAVQQKIRRSGLRGHVCSDVLGVIEAFLRELVRDEFWGALLRHATDGRRIQIANHMSYEAAAQFVGAL